MISRLAPIAPANVGFDEPVTYGAMLILLAIIALVVVVIYFGRRV
jgi:hypothetical protein